VSFVVIPIGVVWCHRWVSLLSLLSLLSLALW
jgi:hypothetical protein